MRPLLFCNIGWMSRYEGLDGQPDQIVGGGSYVTENAHGAEVCNFKVADDGYVYGYVETIKGDSDRKIRLERIGGGAKDSVSGVNVVWTATNPNEGRRRVVGWYRDATVFRDRQHFARAPSRQHGRDRLTSYRVRALAKNVHRLDLGDRTLSMGRGTGWMGHTPWWTPPEDPPGDIREFIDRVQELIQGIPSESEGDSHSDRQSRGFATPSAAASPYWRYVQSYEVRITPRHDELQRRFENYLDSRSATDIRANLNSVDLCFRDPVRGLVLAEIKPCEIGNVRFAIRTAVGQLLDYRQWTPEAEAMLIVLEVKPNKVDRTLATSNGFGIAYPTEAGFNVIWPTSRAASSASQSRSAELDTL